MKKGLKSVRRGILAIAMTSIWLSMQGISGAHCDTLDGPVVATARASLEKGEATPVLKWVKKENEKEIQELFNKTLTVKAEQRGERACRSVFFRNPCPYTPCRRGSA